MVSVCVRYISPAVLGDVGSLVAGPLYRLGSVAAEVTFKDAAGHDLCTRNSVRLVASRNSAYADSVVVDGCDRTCHVGAVRVEVAVVSEHETLAVAAVLIGPKVVDKVLVGRIHKPVHYSHYHVKFSLGIIPPRRDHVDVGTFNAAGHRSVVVIMPLVAELGVVERELAAPPCRSTLA